MRDLVRSGTLLGAALLTLAGCARESVQTFDVGVHHVSVALAPDWTEVDQGHRHLLRRGDVQLVIEDFGPSGREGVRRELERARALWEQGEAREAQTVMRMIPVSDSLFAGDVQRRAFWEIWSGLSDAPDGLDAGEAADRFSRLLVATDALVPRSGEQRISDALIQMGEDERRTIASRMVRRIGDHEVTVVVTWYRIDHSSLRRFAIVDDAGYLLVLRTDQGPPLAEGAFDDVLRTLRVTRPAAQSAPAERRSST